MELKLSEYLTILTYRDHFLIMQGYTGAMILISKRSWKDLFSGKQLNVSPRLKNRIIELLKRSILVPAETDEIASIRSIFEEALRQDSREGYLGLYLTLRCNFACPYCFLNEKQVDISKGIIDKCLREYFDRARNNKAKKLRISFWGGEPMLRFDRLEYAVRLARVMANKQKIKTTFDVVTNGSRFDPHLLNLFSKQKDLDHIQLTLDGPQPIHDSRRSFKGGKGSYRMILNNLPLWMKVARTVLLRINIDDNNIGQIPKLLNELGKFNTKKIEIFPGKVFQGWGRGKSRKEVMSDRSFKIAEKKLATLAEKKGFKVIRNILPQYGPILCKAVAASPGWIGPGGEIYCCNRVVGNKLYRIGRVGRGLYKKKVALWLNQTIIHQKRCLQCKHIFFCGGPCLAQNMLKEKNFALCGRGFKNLIKENIKEYAQKAEEAI